MGWKAIKSINKQEHLNAQQAAPSAVPSPEPVVEASPQNAVRELSSHGDEVISGPGGWYVGIPAESLPEVVVETTSEDLESVVVEDETAALDEKPTAKKPTVSKKKKAPESA